MKNYKTREQIECYMDGYIDCKNKCIDIINYILNWVEDEYIGTRKTVLEDLKDNEKWYNIVKDIEELHNKEVIK